MAATRAATSEISIVVARNLRRLRTRARLTQAALALRAGVTVETVARIERVARGRASANANPLLETLSALAGALGADVTEVVSVRMAPAPRDDATRLVALLHGATPALRRRIEQVIRALIAAED